MKRLLFLIPLLMLWITPLVADDLYLMADDLLQGDPNGNALYKTHFRAVMPEGIWIGEYPNREYPYDLLYKGRPHEVRLFSEGDLQWFVPKIDELRDTYYCGVVTLFNGFYKSNWFPTGDWNGIKVYEWKRPTVMKNFIAYCHSKEYKVCMYFRTPARKEAWGEQCWQDTLTGIQLFIQHNSFDGVYADSLFCGDLATTVKFTQGLRMTVDNSAQRNGFDSGVIISHCSSSAWLDDDHYYTGDAYGNRQGLPDVMVRMMCDYIHTGESMKVAPTGPDHYMMTNFHNDNGLGNALWYKIYRESGSTVYPADVMSQTEIFSMNARLSGHQPIKRTNEKLWKAAYWPIYKQKRIAYD